MNAVIRAPHPVRRERPTTGRPRSRGCRSRLQPKEIKREPVVAPKAETPANLLDGAYRSGYAAGISEGDAKLAEERIRGAVRLGEERAKWSDQQAVAIVNGFAAACQELETNVASSVARILQQFLADAVRDKAVAALVQQISGLTSNPSAPVFRISGPADLLGLVKTQLDTTRAMSISIDADAPKSPSPIRP